MLSKEFIDSKLSAVDSLLSGDCRISTSAASYIGIWDMKSVSSTGWSVVSGCLAETDTHFYN